MIKVYSSVRNKPEDLLALQVDYLIKFLTALSSGEGGGGGCMVSPRKSCHELIVKIANSNSWIGTWVPA
jgi:hypothetical protein